MGNRPLAVGVVLDGSYELRSVVGQGAAGQVWLAHDRELGRPVAIKVVPPEWAARNFEAWRQALKREATALAQVRHPNVAQVYALGRDRELLYFVMEWVEGRPVGEELEHRRAISRPMPLLRALRILEDACRGLSAVHRAGLVHRDVKPHNLLSCTDGRTVLVDFGLVRMPDGSGPSGTPVGTPRYMAPELAGRGPQSAADLHLADVYSLGATAYELLTGAPPFSGEGAHEVLEKHLHEMPRPPSSIRRDLPDGIDRLVLRALAKRPCERFLSTDDMQAAIATAAAMLGKSPSRPRMLVADDDDDFRSQLCTQLKHALPRVRLYSACDGREALELASHVSPHVAIVDVQALGSVALCEALTKQSGLQLVAVSNREPEARVYMERLGVIGFFQKPLASARFLEVIRGLLSPNVGPGAGPGFATG